MTLIIINLGILAIAGLIVTSILIYHRKKQKALVCPIGQHCNEVLKSKYNSIFYFNNDAMGLLYYLLILAEAVYLFFISSDFLVYMQIISGLTVIFSLFLFYLQIRVIRNYCFYCILSVIINILILLNLFLIK